MRKLIATLVLGVSLLSLSACSEPKTICVRGHDIFILMPITVYNGKTSTTIMQMMPIWQCDEEKPNPKYSGKP